MTQLNFHLVVSSVVKTDVYQMVTDRMIAKRYEGGYFCAESQYKLKRVGYRSVTMARRAKRDTGGREAIRIEPNSGCVIFGFAIVERGAGALKHIDH